MSHELKRLSAGSDLIRASLSKPDKVIVTIDSKDLYSFLRQVDGVFPPAQIVPYLSNLYRRAQQWLLPSPALPPGA